ncbi:bifunctional DNA-formamidopyrimidine glycosylase/DNA-(apurinic or apyrimidinic site) lyase [Streptomyces sp. NPDC046831]|uniref:bifunctional DNA-formamidopyrimidine glycosylase/DNA-(apurinic or apyrimidinic site) lyase n=1 Tax=Streptomyces sp. NPDC046831 TaxID=3154805 RepID=UPI0033CFA548
MPELPEVEVVRRGLDRWVAHRTVADVDVLHPRAVRRHLAGAADFAHRLAGHRIGVPSRRGKYLWLPLEDTDQAIVAHLGMSGQLLVQPQDAPDEKHLRIRVRFTGAPAPASGSFESTGPTAWGTELRFVDQRTFGGLSLHGTTADGVPDVIAHIARDPLDPLFDDEAFHQALRRKRTTVKRALLDQTLISGVGNIYADEALWRARIHYERPTATLTRPRTAELLGHIRDVMTAALAVGGTSFDSLYVNVNGESGYFDRSLDAYGREGLPCRRCATPMRRRPWMNRSSYFCPKCQPVPRIRTAPGVILPR